MARPSWDEHPESDIPETVELNLTSLVDVVLVLLVVFMVSSAVMVDKGKSDSPAGVVDLQLPTGKTASNEAPPPEVVVQINADGALFQAGSATEWRSMAKDLAERMAKQPELQVRLEADERLPYQKVMDVILELQSLGIHNIGLATKSAGP